SIPGFRVLEPPEISVRNLAYITQASMAENIELVYYESKSLGFEKKLIAGIVLTRGRVELKHLTQLVEYVTGMDARIGYPNEHIARSTVEEIKSPMYATGIGLVIKALHAIDTGKQGSQPDAKPQKQQRTLGLFDKILQKGRNWLENDIEDSDYLR